NKITNPDTGKPFTKKQAAYYARNLTVNFNKRGSLTNVLGRWYLFFNATMQGMARMAKPFFSGNTRIRWRARLTPLILMGLSQGMIELLRLYMGTDDDGTYYYDKISPWVRAHYF